MKEYRKISIKGISIESKSSAGKSLRWMICALAVYLMFVPLTAAAKGSASDARASVVRIVSEGADMLSCASGFAIGQKGSAAQYFVTAGTALGDASACYAVQDYLFDEYGNTGSIVPLSMVWSDSGMDLVILKSDSALQRFTPACVSEGKKIKKGDTVYIMGYYMTQDNVQPSGINDVVMEANAPRELKADNLGGAASMLFEKDVTIDLLGGPVVDEDGDAAGIFTLGINNSSYIVRGIYGGEIIAAAQKAGINIWTNSDGAEAADYCWVLVIVGAGGAAAGMMRKKRSGKKTESRPQDMQPGMPENRPGGYCAEMVNTGEVQQEPFVQKQPPVQAVKIPADNFAGNYAGNPEHSPILTGVKGYFLNNSVPVKDTIRIGRDSRKCHLIFSEKEPGISSLHCEVTNIGGTANLTDRGSTYGTYLADGTRLGPNQPYPLMPGAEFYIGTKENMFRIDT